MAIDPTNSAIYTVVGYAANGLYKSLDEGVNWNQLLPASIRSATSRNGLVNHISMDPTDPSHLVVDFHVLGCLGTAPPGAQLGSQDFKRIRFTVVISSPPRRRPARAPATRGGAVLAETHDGGDSWSLTTSDIRISTA